jgi:hypothetical protein
MLLKNQQHLRGIKSNRLAAIDIGTNSIRSIIVDVDGEKHFSVLDDEKQTTRIGEGMGKSPQLSAGAMKRAIRALQRMTDIARGFGVQKLQAVATSAVREAKNRESFLRRVESEVGLKVRVISAEEEAWLAFLSMLHHFDLASSAFWYRSWAAAPRDFRDGQSRRKNSLSSVGRRAFDRAVSPQRPDFGKRFQGAAPAHQTAFVANPQRR